MVGLLKAVIGAALFAAVLSVSDSTMAFGQPADKPAVYLPMHELVGGKLLDASGYGLSVDFKGVVDHEAAELDGTPATVIQTELPTELRPGTGSWTVMAWVRPRRFDIDDRQNQRRLFAFGSYPQSFFCVDLLKSGAVSLFQSYQQDGSTPSEGLESGMHLRKDAWQHVAVECDRTTAHPVYRIFINGRLRAQRPISPEFRPDLSAFGTFTVGNGWHNYDGLVQEAALFRSPISPMGIKKLFERGASRLGATLSDEDKRADQIETFESTLKESVDPKPADFAGVVSKLRAAISSNLLPTACRSIASLRLAQLFTETHRDKLALQEYRRIAADASYPAVHRTEARECISETSNRIKGLPARNPSASYVHLAPQPPVRWQLYVAPGGADTAPGTLKQPVATLSAARDLARKIKRMTAGTIAINIAPGRYLASSTLTLSKADSGTSTNPIVYRYRGPSAGKAVFYGGAKITGFVPVTDESVLSRLPAEARGHVLQCNLKALGITEYGALAVRGFSQPPSPPTMELYISGKAMQISRWPNTGFVMPKRLVAAGNVTTGASSVLEYDGDRPARWTQAEDPWIFGYFHYLWADATAAIGKIDTESHTLTTRAPYNYGNAGMSTEQGIKFYAFNLLEEIDEPGEWYLNRNTGILYCYPPAGSDLKRTGAEISMLSVPFLEATGISNVRFERLQFDLARGDGLVLKDCVDCAVAGCTVTRMAGNGIQVLGGFRDTLLSCDINTIGRRATEVIGGDRTTLKSGGHTVANCIIHDFGRIDRTYTPAIQLEGVGGHVVHNLFYNGPSSAMRIEGNNHVMELNETHDVLKESDDQGSMELFGNPTYRGVVFRNNLYHHLGSGDKDHLANGQAAIRLDDVISGMEIYGNIFYRAANGHFGGIQINSGRDNVMDNNLFVESKHGITGGWYPSNEMWRLIREGHPPAAFILSPLYYARYPEMKQMMEPGGINHSWRCVFSGIEDGLARSQSSLDTIADTECIPLQNVKTVHSLELLPSDSVMKRSAFRIPPINEMGIYKDEYRR